MNTSQSLSWVMEHMPKEASDALVTFTSINRQWRGANWDDCLDVLIDSDSHIEDIEPLFDEDALHGYPVVLISAIAITLLYASRPFAIEYTSEMRAVSIKATIDNNGGAPS